MKTVSQLITEIKENGEDFEWYPTTTEIVRAFADFLKAKAKVRDGYGYCGSILDIGCGNGGFFEKLCSDGLFKNVKKYGIEKSLILSEQLPEDVVLLGTDFNQQTLIDKQVDVIFCNPPYSEYEAWAEKIILQGNCQVIALVIPERWKNSRRIKDALERRIMQAEIIGTYDFENAERKARAKVDLIFISAKISEQYGTARKTADPFDVWFDDTFKINAETDEYRTVLDSDRKSKIRNELSVKGDTAETLVRFYNRDMEKLYSNYRQLEKIDADLFKELHVDVPMLKASLKKRLQGLKHIYWDLLFKKYDKITSRLTSAGRKKVIDRLNDNTAIDFTLENIYQLTLWIIRHSNTLFDEQISEYFYSLCNTENIHRYKSNRRWSDDDWRYMKNSLKDKWGYFQKDKAKQLKNVMLDYRIVVTAYSNFEVGIWHPRFTESCHDFLSDTVIIGQNLGFDISFTMPDRAADIDPDDWKNFDIKTTDGKVFANVKLYKNGNRHVKFCKEFMQKLNVEMARINRWVQDKSEVASEMDIPESIINAVWGTNLQIGIESGRQLLGLPV